MRVFLSEFRLYLCNHVISNIPSHRFRLWYYRKIMGFKIGAGSAIFMNCKFDCTKGLTIGDNCVINAKCRLDSRGEIYIGNNVSLSEEVICLTSDHNEDIKGIYDRSKKIIIEDYVWVGTRAMILAGVKLEKGAMIAAGAVVTRNVDCCNVVAGVPAKQINSRPQDFNYPTNYKRLFQ